MLPDNLAESCIDLQVEQLRALRVLMVINFQFITRRRRFTESDISHMLDAFSAEVEHLQMLEESLDAYRREGVDCSKTIMAELVAMRWKRLLATRARAEARVEAFHKSMPLHAPSLTMHDDGSFLRNQGS